jgi:hypothetical protein
MCATQIMTPKYEIVGELEAPGLAWFKLPPMGRPTVTYNKSKEG